jgi:hypothetical protein
MLERLCAALSALGVVMRINTALIPNHFSARSVLYKDVLYRIKP